jgi:hypothetical protein
VKIKAKSVPKTRKYLGSEVRYRYLLQGRRENISGSGGDRNVVYGPHIDRPLMFMADFLSFFFNFIANSFIFEYRYHYKQQLS